MSDCIFCKIVAGESPATFVAESVSAIVIEPLAPAAPGHWLVIPREHVEDASTDPALTGRMFEQATRLLHGRQANLLTSVGPMATQTVRHLHIHLIPRGDHDGLHEDWPWHRNLYDHIRPLRSRRRTRADVEQS